MFGEKILTLFSGTVWEFDCREAIVQFFSYNFAVENIFFRLIVFPEKIKMTEKSIKFSKTANFLSPVFIFCVVIWVPNVSLGTGKIRYKVFCLIFFI